MVLARDILENEVQVPLLLAGLEDRHDARMTQLADQTRFFEQLPVLLWIGPGEVQRLDRHLPLQMRVTREIDDALGTPTQLTNDLETSNSLAHSIRSSSQKTGIPYVSARHRKWHDWQAPESSNPEQSWRRARSPTNDGKLIELASQDTQLPFIDVQQ